MRMNTALTVIGFGLMTAFTSCRSTKGMQKISDWLQSAASTTAPVDINRYHVKNVPTNYNIASVEEQKDNKNLIFVNYAPCDKKNKAVSYKDVFYKVNDDNDLDSFERIGGELVLKNKKGQEVVYTQKLNGNELVTSVAARNDAQGDLNDNKMIWKSIYTADEFKKLAEEAALRGKAKSVLRLHFPRKRP